jgi:nicotinate phosphoribosyltransferase
MLQAFFEKNTDAVGRYVFKDRTEAEWTPEMIDEVKAEIDHLCTLRFQDDEIEYLRGLGFFKPGFLEFLRLFQYNRDHIAVTYGPKKRIHIEAEGPYLYDQPFRGVPFLPL